MDPVEELTRLQDHIREALHAARAVAGKPPPAEVAERLNGAAHNLDGLREELRSLAEEVQTIKAKQDAAEQRVNARLIEIKEMFTKPPWVPPDATVPKDYPVRLRQFMLDNEPSEQEARALLDSLLAGTGQAQPPVKLAGRDPEIWDDWGDGW